MIKPKLKFADKRMNKWNYVKDQQKKVMLQIPGLYPTKSSIRPPFTHLTDKNLDPMEKCASKSNHDHVFAAKPLKAKEGFLASSVEKSNPQLTRPMHGLVCTKEGFPARLVEKSNPQLILPKQMCGSVRGVHNAGTFEQYGVRLKGQSTMTNDNCGEELKFCKVKNDSISKESTMAKGLMVNKGNLYEDNTCDKICGEVMMGDDKKILHYVNLCSTKSLKRDYIPSTCGDRYKDIMKGNEVSNPSPLTKDERNKYDIDECEDSKNPRPNKKQR
uniref:Uncharacterized protein n=1 Tax=Oryza punctata TaxID=4537 RepID=A0A0E0LBT3_ORYPU